MGRHAAALRFTFALRLRGLRRAGGLPGGLAWFAPGCCRGMPLGCFVRGWRSLFFAWGILALGAFEKLVDLAPEGWMVVTRHHDQPGVLGAISTVLGEAGVNIRRVDLGPRAEENAGYASAFLVLYDEPSEDTLARIAELEPVVSAHRIDLG